MPHFGLATLNHSPLHGLPTQWEAHLDAALDAGFDAIAPDIFWLRALEAEGVELGAVSEGLRARGLDCMELAGIAIGDEETTRRELEENLRYAQALRAEFVNARIVEPLDDAVVARVRHCARVFRDEGTREGGTRLALEFSRGSKLTGVGRASELVQQVDVPGTGVTIDTWHFCLHPDGPDWEALDRLPAERLANVQLSDGVPYGPGTDEGGFGQATMDRRRLPGQGAFELDRVVAALEAKGFDGAIVVEVLSAEERSRSVGEFARRARVATQRVWPGSAD
jgi:sugar phosphate isomerase/epimerase